MVSSGLSAARSQPSENYSVDKPTISTAWDSFELNWTQGTSIRCRPAVPRSLQNPRAGRPRLRCGRSLLIALLLRVAAGARAEAPADGVGPDWARALAWTGVGLLLAQAGIACLERLALWMGS